MNPSYTLVEQLWETLYAHRKVIANPGKSALYLMERVGIPQAWDRLRQYPHQLSGGFR
ncbi:MAG: hypothetical protein ACR5LD_02840 [Symbiopectobacterium sp.]